MVRTAWASARIQVGPSKVNPETFARAMRERGLSLPECFHAGERELSAENVGWEQSLSTQRKTELGDEQDETTFELLDIAMPEASRPGTYRPCEPIKILFGLSWLQVSFSHTNTRILPIARDSGPKFYLTVTLVPEKSIQNSHISSFLLFDSTRHLPASQHWAQKYSLNEWSSPHSQCLPVCWSHIHCLGDVG